MREWCPSALPTELRYVRGSLPTRLIFCALDKAMVDPEGFEPSASEDSRDVRRSTKLSYGPIYQPRGTKGVLGLEINEVIRG